MSPEEIAQSLVRGIGLVSVLACRTDETVILEANLTLASANVRAAQEEGEEVILITPNEVLYCSLLGLEYHAP